MSIHFVGEAAAAAPPFDSLFFKTAFDAIVEKAGKVATRLTLFLSDGTTFDVCQIEDLADAYMILRGYRGGTDACELAINVIPYGLIYRLELGPKGANESRVGFSHTPTTVRKKGKPGR
jgi:hypothetical protein